MGGGQQAALAQQIPEPALLTTPNIREYFYTKIRFSTPGLSALLPLAGQIFSCRENKTGTPSHTQDVNDYFVV
jgi:hypothetical protein